jgi:hypothetical protein
MYSKPSMFIREIPETSYMTQNRQSFFGRDDDEEKIIYV